MITDAHLHTQHSADSEQSVPELIEHAITLGMSEITITDHHDFDFVVDNMDFCMNSQTYYTDIQRWKEHYCDKIRINIGVEVGIEPKHADALYSFVKEQPFDFVIGSSHLINGKDPYYPEFFEGKSESDTFMEYFESILANVDAFTDFDVYGHIDYIIRYAPNKTKHYSYALFQDIIDEILKKLISFGKGIEVNTGGYRSGLGFPNPHFDIIKRYRELGGEIITFGSDAHKACDLGSCFNEAARLVADAGFTHYAIFHNRKADFYPII